MDAGRFSVSDVQFAADGRLPLHAHPHGCLAVVVDGFVRKRIAGREMEAGPGIVLTMPAEEPHEDRFGPAGAHIVVVESCGIESVSGFRDWNAVLLAWRIARELAEPDRFTPLALEGMALELTAVAERFPGGRGFPSRLETARDYIRERFRDSPPAGDVAAAAGLHPAHLARAFRSRYGETLGGYARRLRLEWAAVQLLETDVPLACLAAEAGFADQSHFTRSFTRLFGVPPGRYRAAGRSGAAEPLL
jgi:AraC family transcriptional regulator